MTVLEGGELASAPVADGAGDLGIAGLVGAEVIGTGGFATVYKAEQPAHARTVAVKVLRVDPLDEEARDRFERECKALGSLSSHPAIVTVYESGFTEAGEPYLVMEHLSGGSLEDRLQKDGALPWSEAAEVGGVLAGALQASHEANIVHRDVKPANVLISRYGAPQLGDFGIARLDGGRVTKSGVITATLAHVPPEVLSGENPDERSDIYSLGSTLFELVSGAPAFLRQSDEIIFPVMKRIEQDPVPDLRDEGVPDALCAVIERAMAKAPDDRYASAEELREALIEAGSPAASSGDDDKPDANATIVVALGAEPEGAEEPAAEGGEPPADGDDGPEDAEAGTGGDGTDGDGTDSSESSESSDGGGTDGDGPDGGAAPPPAGPVTGPLGQTGDVPTGVPVVTVNIPAQAGGGGRRWLVGLLVVALIAALAAAAYGFTQKDDSGDDTAGGASTTTTAGVPLVAVPNLVSASQAEAEADLRNQGFLVEVEEAANPFVADGVVYEQQPAAGTELEEGATVVLRVSTGPPLVTIPDVVGLNVFEALGLLRDELGLSVSFVQEPSEQTRNIVIAQDPDVGETVAVGTRITVTLSEGPAEQVVLAVVPTVEGLAELEARSRLEDAGFLVAVADAAADAGDPGTVARTDPVGGTQVQTGSRVVMFVVPGGGDGGG